MTEKELAAHEAAILSRRENRKRATMHRHSIQKSMARAEKLAIKSKPRLTGSHVFVSGDPEHDPPILSASKRYPDEYKIYRETPTSNGSLPNPRGSEVKFASVARTQPFAKNEYEALVAEYPSREEISSSAAASSSSSAAASSSPIESIIERIDMIQSALNDIKIIAIDYASSKGGSRKKLKARKHKRTRKSN